MVLTLNKQVNERVISICTHREAGLVCKVLSLRSAYNSSGAAAAFHPN